MASNIEPAQPRWSVAPYFIVNDVVSTANYYRDKLGFQYDRFWNVPPSFCMVTRSGVIIMLAQHGQPGAMRPNRLVDPEGEAEYTVQSWALSDHTGRIHVDAHVDIADSKDTKLEDVVIDSLWNAFGAGRADIAFAGGDLDSTTPMVDAVECWGTDFQQSFYRDSVGFSPTVGTESECVYPSK